MSKRSADSKEPVEGSVTLCIRLQKYVLNGRWTWDMQSSAVYCSDVMEFPQQFEGTKGIIHPDDLPKVSAALQVLIDGEVAQLDFRLITTYGEIKAISGQNVSLDKPGHDEEPPKEKAPWEESLEALALRREADYLQQRRSTTDATEKLHRIGTWAINRSTGEAWYSDGMYHLHGLPPQSLNHHANTFQPFLHPDDRLPFLDVFETAYEAELPVHIEYRILAGGEPLMVRLVSYWSYNSKGQPIFTGILRDLTEDWAKDEEVKKAQSRALLHQHLLKFSEQTWNTGYWFLDLVTRKMTYSDNYYRIYGLKQPMPASNAFLNLVHPDDRLRVRSLIEGMYSQHQVPDAEFRIIRPDGRQRQLKQSGRLFNTESNLLMIGTVQDVTVLRGLEKKIAELNEGAALHEAIRNITESLTETAFITWHSDGYVAWSEGFFRLLGYKPGAVEPSPKLLHKQIHPDDAKAFKDAETLVANGQPHDSLRFRLFTKGDERQLRISFHRIGNGAREVAVGVVKDLTREEALHRKLAETARYAETLNTTTSDMVILTDTENTVLSWNRAAEEKTSIAAADALYSNLFDLFPLLLDEAYMGRLHSAMVGGEVKEVKARNLYLRKAHNYFLTPIKNEEGEVLRVLHVVQDVSRELDLQQQLSERLNFIESLVEASVDRIVVLDKHMNYLYWNKQAEAYYAVTKERVIGHNILDVFPGFRNDPSYSEFRRVLRGETVYLPPVPAGENAGYFETYLIPIKDEREDVMAILWIVHDLRNELQLQQVERKAKQELEEEHRRLKEAQALGRVGSFEWEAGSEVSHWSDELYRIHNLEPQSEEMTLDKADQFIHPDDFAALQGLKETSFHRPGQYQLVHRIVLRNGEVRWVAHEWESLADEKGTVTRITGVVQDITEKKKAEEELAQRQELLQAAMDSSLDMIQVFKAVRNEQGGIVDFQYVLMNHEAEKWMPDAIGKTLLQLQPGVAEEGIFDAFKQVVETGLPQQYEKHYVHEQFNGWFYQSVVKLDDGVATTTKDITKRKRAEEHLKESRDLVQTVFDVSLNPIAYHKAVRDASGKIVDFEFELENQEARKYAKEDHTGKRYSEAYPGIEDTAVFKLYCDVVETGTEMNTEIQITLKGADHWFHLMAVKLDDGLVATAVDVTERKRAQEEILRLKDEVAQKAADKYQSLFNSINEGFCIMELLFDENGKITDLVFREQNPAFDRHTGLGHVVGKTLNELLPGFKQPWINIYEQIVKTGEAFRQENYVPEVGRWFSTHHFLVGSSGSPFVAAAFSDITERKRNEANIVLLKEVNEALLQLESIGQTMKALCEKIGVHFDAAVCAFSEVNEAQGTVQATYRWHRDGTPSSAGVCWISDYHSNDVQQLLRCGKPEVVQDLSRFPNAVAERMQALGIGAYVNLPFVHNGEWRATLSITKSKPHGWREDEIDLMRELTFRIWTRLERVRAEEALRKNEEQLRRLSVSLEQQVAERTAELQKHIAILQEAEELAQIGSWEYDLASRNFNWSEGMYRLFGLPQNSKVSPETYLHFSAEEDRSAAKRIVKNLKKEHRDFKETMHIRRGSDMRLLRIKATVVHDEQGKPQRMVGVDLDITDINQAEEKVRETQHWLQQTALASPDGITVYDLQKKQPFFLNNCLANWIGTTSDELVRLGIDGRLELVHPDDRLKLLHFNEMMKAASDGEVLTLEYRIRTKEDSLLWLRNRSKVFQRDKHGVVTHILSILQDITDEKEAHDVLNRLNASLEKKNQELEQKNDEITSFAFVASHDLKEPLRKIHTFGDWILTREKSLSEEGRQYLQRMSGAVRRLDLLIDDILALTKVHVNNEQAKKVDLNVLLQRLKEELAEKLDETGAVIEAETLPTITGAENLLFYLFKNLISNAIKFQPAGRKPHLYIRAEKENGYSKVSFTDNGIGIPGEFHRKIFEMFRRLHGRTEYEGTGMGLAICKKIMEKHGGKITVDSKEGKGATFTCWFP